MFCVKCGNKNDEGAAFCFKCGARLISPTNLPSTHEPGSTHQYTNNVQPYVSGDPNQNITDKRILAILLGFVRLIIAIYWINITFTATTGAMGVIWNVISVIIQLGIALIMLATGFGWLAKPTDTLLDRLDVISGSVYFNLAFAGISVLWYGFQVLFMNVHMLSLVIVEIIVVAASIAAIYVIQKMMEQHPNYNNWNAEKELKKKLGSENKNSENS